MAYMGQDWRQPGPLWVRTSVGWEQYDICRQRIFDNLNENFLARSPATCRKFADERPNCPMYPHAFIERGTRQKSVQTCFSEVFDKLHLEGAVSDIRRFNYVADVLDIIFKQKLSYLSGNAQKKIFSLLETEIRQAIANEREIYRVVELVNGARKALEKGFFFHVGSAALWQRHGRMLDKMQNCLTNFSFSERSHDGHLTLSELPVDCVRQILYRLADHRDVFRTGMTERRTLAIVQEEEIWRQLCLYHFKASQLRSLTLSPTPGQASGQNSWQALYKRLVQRFGKKVVYADSLYMCRMCSAVFWKKSGHHCLDDSASLSVPLTPTEFLKLCGV